MATIVFPKGDPRLRGTGESQVHPAVMIEIQDGDTLPDFRFGHWPEVTCKKLPFPRVLKHQRRLCKLCNHEIDCAVVVIVSAHSSGTHPIARQSACLGDIGERSISIVAPKHTPSPSRTYD